MTTRLYVDSELSADSAIGLEASRAHYLRTVLRLRPGDPVLLFNGRAGEWRARIAGFGKGWASLDVLDRLRAQPDGADAGPWLLFAPLKRARIDFLVQKATELGVAGLWPVWTRHTAVERVRVDRLVAIAVEAAEQCGRLSVPAVREPADLGDVIDRWERAPETRGRRLYLCAERGAAQPIGELGAHGPHPAALLIGPEGGWTGSELDALGKLPFVTAVGLGPRILRAETAALSALAVYQALCGDGKERPSERESGT